MNYPKCSYCGEPMWRWKYVIGGKQYCHACVDKLFKIHVAVAVTKEDKEADATCIT